VKVRLLKQGKCLEYRVAMFKTQLSYCREFDTFKTLASRDTASPMPYALPGSGLCSPQNYEINEASAKRVPSSMVSSSPILTFNTVGFEVGLYYKFH
jgi:hypothetical protein